ncbi:MAG: PEGA domain-containing protein [Candidatus Omnitrophica bacterium]|nr:PEGA domain-containing protein [Candidatus Omnitrophota bacterium]
MYNFQKIRFSLFFLSVLVFFLGLPLILFFAFGYKFDNRSLKFVKTGLIFVKTQPAGARIYFNGKLLTEKTPTSMQELLPGTYRISLEMEQHYPWKGEVEVEAGKVSRMDKIILFPVRPNLQQLNQESFNLFFVDPDKKSIYYLDQGKGVVYRSGLDSGIFEDVASLPDKFEPINGWAVSPDRRKLFVFNQRQIGVVFFDNRENYEYPVSPVLLDYRREKVAAAFWHSDSYHLVVLTDKHIQVIESRPGALPVNLVELNNAEKAAFYDFKEDVLYFSDAQRSPDGEIYNNLYKLELHSNLYSLERLIIQPFEGIKSAQKEDNGE